MSHISSILNVLWVHFSMIPWLGSSLTTWQRCLFHGSSAEHIENEPRDPPLPPGSSRPAQGSSWVSDPSCLWHSTTAYAAAAACQSGKQVPHFYRKCQCLGMSIAASKSDHPKHAAAFPGPLSIAWRSCAILAGAPGQLFGKQVFCYMGPWAASHHWRYVWHVGLLLERRLKHTATSGEGRWDSHVTLPSQASGETASDLTSKTRAARLLHH